MKTPEQIAAFHQDNVAAIMASGQILAGGAQAMSSHVAQTAQSAMAEAMSVWRAMAGARSVQEALALQGSFARAAMEKGLAHSHHLAETGLRVAEQAASPLTARVDAAMAAITRAS